MIVVLGVFAGGVGWKYLKGRTQQKVAHQQMQAVPTLAAGAPVAEGSVVRVTGVVRATQTVTAPLSGRTCVAYRTLITHQVAMGIGDHTQANTAETFEMRPFMLDCGPQGTVVVDATYAHLYVGLLHDSQLDMPSKERFVLARGLSMREAVLAQFSESVIEPGMTVTVAGALMQDAAGPGAMTGYRDSASSPRLTGTPQQPVVIGPG